jgi:hypothetical protein
MSETIHRPSPPSRPKKKLTMMFYFAADNPLAASIIVQLKALKAAGYHPEVNVVTQFDPQVVGTPTHIFDVNLLKKIEDPESEHRIGLGTNPCVLSLLEDRLWEDDLDGRLIKHRVKTRLANKGLAYDPPTPPNGHGTNGTGPTLTAGGNGNGNSHREPSPADALGSFLTFCADNYKADHYMLFLLGHGMIVGNDAFLFDEHADTPSMTLPQLGARLRDFAGKITQDGSAFDLVGFHCCSVSSVEVAFELQYTANYMMASQGPAFVGSWPYRSILLRVLSKVDEALKSDPKADLDMESLIEKQIFNYCYYNSIDYVLAGYSFDLCLTDLTQVCGGVAGAIKRLSCALKDALEQPMLRNLILLAHWRSQSYWHQNYTDLYDFCFCLRNYCRNYAGLTDRNLPDDEPEELDGPFPAVNNLYAVCGEVQRQLRTRPPGGHGVIARSEYAGPAYQYSHGLSVYFPWTQPPSDERLWFGPEHKAGTGDYSHYMYNVATGWGAFLQQYFEKTQRQTRKTEQPATAVQPGWESETPDDAERRERELERRERERLEEDMLSLVYNDEGSLSSTSALPAPEKQTPIDATGVGGDCCAIKNFPRETRAAVDAFPLSQYGYADAD